MNAADFIAGIIATGRIGGVGIGSALADVEAAFPLDYLDDTDEEMVSLRRDYGLVEFFFNDGPAWVVVGAAVEVHRLAAVPELREEWQGVQGVVFPESVAWSEVKESLSHLPSAPELQAGTEQAGYMEFRAQDTKVSVFLVDSSEDDASVPGPGDLFSVSLG